MAVGSALGLTLPTPGSTTDWGDDLNTVLQALIDAVEADVPVGGININDDLTFSGNDLTSVGTIRMNDEAAELTGTTDTNKIYTFDGELYFTDGAQQSVKITDNGGVNVAATGGVGGAGYGTLGVEINWDSVNTEYELKSATGENFARAKCNGVRIVNGTYYTQFDSAVTAANYTLTLPAAKPSVQKFMVCDSTGQIAFSNAIEQGATFAANCTFNSTTSMVGVATLTNPVMNDYSLTDQHFTQHPLIAMGTDATYWLEEVNTLTSPKMQLHLTSAPTGERTIVIPLQFDVGVLLDNVAIFCRGSVDYVVNFKLLRSSSAGTVVSIATGATTATDTNQTITLSSLAYTTAGSSWVGLAVANAEADTGVGEFYLYGIRSSWTRP